MQNDKSKPIWRLNTVRRDVALTPTESIVSAQFTRLAMTAEDHPFQAVTPMLAPVKSRGFRASEASLIISVGAMV